MALTRYPEEKPERDQTYNGLFAQLISYVKSKTKDLEAGIAGCGSVAQGRERDDVNPWHKNWMSELYPALKVSNWADQGTGHLSLG